MQGAHLHGKIAEDPGKGAGSARARQPVIFTSVMYVRMYRSIFLFISTLQFDPERLSKSGHIWTYSGFQPGLKKIPVFLLIVSRAPPEAYAITGVLHA